MSNITKAELELLKKDGYELVSELYGRPGPDKTYRAREGAKKLRSKLYSGVIIEEDVLLANGVFSTRLWVKR